MAYVSAEPVALVVHVHVDVTETFTTAIVHGEVSGVWAQGVGTAKRHPHDKSNPLLGGDLAIARALIELGLELEASALKEAGA
jgi:hypothetical protein